MKTVVPRLCILALLIPASLFAQEAPRPTITSLYPDAVHAGWKGVLKIKGTNFDNRSFALIDGKAPQTTYKSETLLEVELTSDITGTPGNKGVKVHSGGGGLSSEKILVVLKGSTAAKSHSVPIARTGGAITTGRDPAGFHFLP